MDQLQRSLPVLFQLVLFAHIDFKIPPGQRLDFIEIYFTVHFLRIQVWWKAWNNHPINIAQLLVWLLVLAHQLQI